MTPLGVTGSPGRLGGRVAPLLAAGELAHVTDDVHRFTGRAPMSLADVLGAGT